MKIRPLGAFPPFPAHRLVFTGIRDRAGTTGCHSSFLDLSDWGVELWASLNHYLLHGSACITRLCNLFHFLFSPPLDLAVHAQASSSMFITWYLLLNPGLSWALSLAPVPTWAIQQQRQCSVLYHIKPCLLGWLHFPAWPWPCLVAVNCPGHLVSWLSQVAVSKPAVLLLLGCSGSARRGSGSCPTISLYS